ncbi:cbb3-type cytochrome oxidase assembly protein CcoS [Stutzerimonas stutzeri]|uniref:cbb3-type cytochrome oxidase assembly protein CcoS n=1 Tax=Stutzerimonas sp. S1 TaxID=3030652 RepID=UPI00222583F3|nr:cbb3-type cytochrome oxidase assembly protein CcoS [Stutzerimonas sp. S1]MCW3148230.1 cbb3-type cytochrome oxidase assembly protein CcoS [Stutzerimonas sp. S1]
MAALYILIPVAVVLVAAAIWVFFWAVDSGQYDDLDGPAHSILFDDDEVPQSSEGATKSDQDAAAQEKSRRD